MNPGGGALSGVAAQLGGPATLSALGHALAGPLITARGNLEAAVARHPEDADIASAARAVARAGVVVGAVTRMSGAARTPEPAPVLLDDVLRTALRRLRALMDPPVLHATPLPEVFADEEHLVSLLGEVLANAAVHGGPGTQVRIRAAEAGPGAVRVSITDDGPGLPDGMDTAHLRYFRPGKGSGAGCGLALARDLAEVNGGTLTVADGPVGGLSVEVTLPTGAG